MQMPTLTLISIPTATMTQLPRKFSALLGTQTPLQAQVPALDLKTPTSLVIACQCNVQAAHAKLPAANARTACAGYYSCLSDSTAWLLIEVPYLLGLTVMFTPIVYANDWPGVDERPNFSGEIPTPCSSCHQKIVSGQRLL